MTKPLELPPMSLPLCLLVASHQSPLPQIPCPSVQSCRPHLFLSNPRGQTCRGARSAQPDRRTAHFASPKSRHKEKGEAKAGKYCSRTRKEGEKGYQQRNGLNYSVSCDYERYWHWATEQQILLSPSWISWHDRVSSAATVPKRRSDIKDPPPAVRVRQTTLRCGDSLP